MTIEPRTMARLDRLYTFVDPTDPTTRVSYRILWDCSHADHLPVLRQVFLAEVAKRQSPSIMNAIYIQEKEVQEDIQQIWGRGARLPFYGKLCKCVKFYCEYCISGAAAATKEKSRLHHQPATIRPGRQTCARRIHQCSDPAHGS